MPESLYSNIDPSTIPAAAHTGYKWSFASDKLRVDNEALRMAREAVGAATYGLDSRSQAESNASPSGSGRIQGPTLPSASDLLLAREAASEFETQDRAYDKKRKRAEAKEKIEEMVGPKEVGREGMLEKKRARREGDRAFREKGDDGFEADEATLLGGGDSFKERWVFLLKVQWSALNSSLHCRIARRDAARKRFEEKRNPAREEKAAAVRERVSVIREKDKAVMDMFQQMAKQRFG